MPRALRVTSLAAPLLTVLLLGGPVEATAKVCDGRGLSGRPLADALEDLRACGLRLIYSSDLVRPEMVVKEEPGGPSLRSALEELLAPHGLGALDGRGGRVLIVSAKAEAGSTGGIEGRILAMPGQIPVPNARVILAGLAAGATSSTDATSSKGGRFTFRQIPAGRYRLEISIGGASLGQFDEIRVAADDISRVTLQVSLPPSLVEKLTVRPDRREISGDQPEPRDPISAEALQAIPHLGSDLHRAISHRPGFAGGDRSAELSIRGGTPDEVLFILDGLELLDPFHLKAFQSFSGIVDSRTIEKADILTGSFPAEYGDRMSGVIDLSSSLYPTGPRTISGTNFINSHFLSNGAFPGSGAPWLLSARAWYPDALNDVLTPAGDEIGPKYSDLFAKARFQLSDATTVTGNVLLSYDTVNYTSDAEAASDQEIMARSRSQYGWFRLDSAPARNLLARTHVSFGQISGERTGSAADEPEKGVRIRDQRSFEMYGVKQDWSFRVADPILLKFGLEAKRVNGIFDYLLAVQSDSRTSERRVSLAPSGDEYGAYAAGRFRIHRALVAELGARWDRQTYTSESQLSPRINLLNAWGERSALRLGWGRFYQSQGIHELQVEDGVDEFSPAQLSENWFVSFDHGFARGLQLKVSAYSKRMSRVRPRFENLFDPIELFPEAEPDRVRVAPERSEARGLEISLTSGGSELLNWWANYALSSVEDEIDGAMVPRSWDQKHALNFGASIRPNPGWSLDIAGIYHTGWPTTSVQGGIVEAADSSRTIQPILGPRNAERFPAYHRLDLKVSRHVRLARGRLTFYLEVLNLYDQENPCCVDDFRFVPLPDGTVRTIREEDFWLGRLPTLGVVWELGR